MAEIPLHELSMTRVEELLKQTMKASSGLRSGVMSAEELTDYLLHITDKYTEGDSVPYPTGDLSVFPNITRTVHVINNLERFSAKEQFPQNLVIHREVISENQEILTNYDISVGRMLRYYPAHWHANDSFEIYYALSGNCPIYFEDEVITVKPGTVLIVAPSVLHASPCYADDSVLLYYLVRSSTFDRVFWNQIPSDNLMSAFFRQALSAHKSNAYLHFETGGDEEIRDLLYRMYVEYRSAQRYAAQMLNALMSEFFVLLLRRYEGTARLPRTKDFYWKHEFSAILTYIQTHFATATQAEVAAHFHYSDRQIGRIVQNCTGMNYAQLILKLRMEQAGKLLRQKTASIDAIAAAVGYSTPCSFYRAFSKYYGCTPRAFSGGSTEQKDNE